MNALEIVAGVFLLIACLLIIISTMMQNPKQGGLGSSFGSTGSYLGRNTGRTMDAVLARLTKLGGIIFFVLTILAGIISVYVG